MSSHRHKESNTYKFISFHERIASIRIDLGRKFGRFDLTPQEADTFFGEALAKWTDLNCTEHFVNFRRQVYKEVNNLAQVVHHQKDIVDALDHHLNVPNSLALEPLLDLVVQLARDLQSDFMPYFERFLMTVVRLLNIHHHEPEHLEHLMATLAYLFKFLWKHLIKDMLNVYRLFSPLLGSAYKDYTKSFAAEGFAFLMRKCKDKPTVIGHMFDDLALQPDRARGLGRLLFETVKLARNQFHHCLSDVIKLPLQKLSDTALPSNVVYEAANELYTLLAAYTNSEHASEIWQQLETAVRDASDAETGISLHHLLTLLYQFIAYHSGSLLAETPDAVVRLVESLLDRGVKESCQRPLLLCASSLIMNIHRVLTSTARRTLVSKVLKLKASHDLKHDFIIAISSNAFFKQDCLPVVLSYCNDITAASSGASSDTCQRALATLCHLVLSKVKDTVVFDNADDNSQATQQAYELYFPPTTTGGDCSHFTLWMLERVKSLNGVTQLNADDFEALWSIVYLIQHVSFSAREKTDWSKVLRAAFTKLFTSVVMATYATEADQVLKVSRQCFNALLAVEPTIKCSDVLHANQMTEALSKHSDSVWLLSLCDAWLARAKNEISVLTRELFKSLYESLSANLQSPHSQVRTLTLRIFNHTVSILPPPKVQPELEQPVEQSVFDVCLLAESIVPSVHNYRQKIIHLQKLNHEHVARYLPADGSLDLVPLKYLLGVVYTNFSLIWKPLMDLLASHARGLPIDTFWSLFSNCLQSAATNAEKVLYEASANRKQVDSEGSRSLASAVYEKKVVQLSPPDHRLYRDHLWQAMAKFTEICERRSRHIVQLLFRFLENEYYPADLAYAPTQDLRRQSAEDASKADVNSDGEEEGEGFTEMNKAGQQRRRASNKTLVTHLMLFSQFSNPHALVMEPKLYSLYHELLQHRDLGVQTTAFKCLMTYRLPYLTPYRENFERILDDKHFKNELVVFSISEDAGVINEVHRPQLMPVLMAMLYGKMQTKTGKDTSGRGLGHMRKNIVLRFLAGCLPHELSVFLDMVFKPFVHFMTGSITEQVDALVKSTDFSSIIPLRKQLGTLRTVEFVIGKLGHRMESAYLSRLLQLVVCLAAGSLAITEHRHMINDWVIPPARTLRSMAQLRLCEFFDMFTNYAFSREEIDALFTAVVWPKVDKLPLEGVHSPVPLLRLFVVWSRHSRYHELLAKVHPVTCATVLPHLFSLLVAEATQESVTDVIVTIIHSLVTHDVAEDDAMMADSDKPQGPPVDAGPTADTSCYGANVPRTIAILLPHVGAILQYLRQRIGSIGSGAGKKKKSLPELEFGILARLSEYVTTAGECEDIAHMLIKLLRSKVVTSPDSELDILRTVTHLVRHATHPENFLLPLTPLFSAIPRRAARTALCDVLSTIGQSCSAVEPLTNAIIKINAWDRRHVESPDYMKRIEGFSQANALLKTLETADALAVFALVIHNACFMLSNVDDMAIRDVSAGCLHKIVDELSSTVTTDVATVTSRQQAVTRILNDHLQPLVLRDIRHKTESIRHEFIGVLAHMVRGFATPQYTHFTQLSALLDSDADAEVDFFVNITHIQLHRRARALLRLAKHLSSVRMQSSVISTYLLPLVTHFVTDEAFTKHTNITDAAVEAIGAACRQLSWPHYLAVLRNQLRQVTKSMDRQKLAVRLMTVVLDSFHFDLRHFSEAASAESVDQQLQSPKVNEDVSKSEEDAKMADDEENASDVEAEPAAVSDSGTSLQFTVICAPGPARRIYATITGSILPLLHRLLTMKAQSDDEHKAAHGGKYVEDVEILRVPLALATVRLLQVLPPGPLHTHLPGVLLKVCQFMKSRSIDIRTTARETMVKIAQALGAHYMPYIIKEMKSILTRGYQVHILCHVTWTLLNSLTEHLKPGDLDISIKPLTEIFNQELFGMAAEEKEVAGILRSVPEAKSSKSADSYGLLARYVSAACLRDLLTPLQQVLETTHSLKTARKAADVLAKVAVGLVANTDLDLCTVLTFIYQLTIEASESTADKSVDVSVAKQQETAADRRPPSTLLLKATTPRGSAKPKAHKSTNVHILLEFSLQVLLQLLKQSSLSSQNLEHLQLLDPFISQIDKCLSSKHIKVVGGALRCLSWLLKYPLPSLKGLSQSVTNCLFVLLHTYAGRTSTHGDNVQLVTLVFKVVTTLIREVRYQQITQDQLHVLLGYVEQDIAGHTRQTAAFNLLKAILARRLVSDEVHEVMKKVEKLSVVSEVTHVRLQCRQVTLQYLVDYPLGRKLQAHLEFFISQLEYEYESGRESVLEMMATIFATFPQALLVEYSGLFFVPLASRLASDESPRCRRLTSLAIKSLLDKLPIEQRDKLLTMCFAWLSDKKLSVRQLSAMLLRLFVEVEGVSFNRYLDKLLAALEREMRPNLSAASGDKSLHDLLLYHELTLLSKTIEHCQLLHDTRWTATMNTLWGYVSEHLLYPHAWVRLAASQLFGQLFASYEPEKLASSIVSNAANSSSSADSAKHKKKKLKSAASLVNGSSHAAPVEYLLDNGANKLRVLCLQTCDQLSAAQVDDELAEQVAKNLVFLGKVVHHLDAAAAADNGNVEENEDDDEETGEDAGTKRPSLQWLSWRLCREVRMEIAHSPKVTVKRSCVFKWTAAMAMFLGGASLLPCLPRLIKLLVREVTDASSVADGVLRQLAQEVLEVIKSVVGNDVFSQQYAAAHQSLSERRGSRKLQRAQQAVIRPEVAARRRIKKHVALKEAKKRKLDDLRPTRKVKRSRVD